MAKFSSFDAPTGTAGPIRVRRATAEDFGGGVGKGLQVFAKAMANTGTFLKDKAIQSEKTAVRDSFLQAGFDFTQSLQQKFDDGPEGAEGLSDGMAADLNAFIAKQREGLTTAEGKELASTLAVKLRGSIMGRAVGLQAKESARFQVQQINTSVATINNRVTSDFTYYESGEAQADLDELVKDLSERGLTGKALEGNKRRLQTELDYNGAQSILANATDFLDAERLVDELAKPNNRFEKTLDTDKLRAFKKAANANLIKVLAAEETEDNESITEKRADNSARILATIVAATGEDGPEKTKALARGVIILDEALASPLLFVGTGVRALDRILDADKQAEVKRLNAAAKTAAESIDLKRKWTVADLSVEVQGAKTMSDVLGLRVAINALARQKAKGDKSGITPAEFEKLQVTLLRKIHGFTSRAEKLTAKELKAKDKAFRDQVKLIEKEEYGELANRASNATTLEDVAAIRSGLLTNEKLLSGHKLIIRDRLRRTESRLMKRAAKVQKEIEKEAGELQKRTADISAKKLDRWSQRSDLTPADARDITVAADQSLEQYRLTGTGLTPGAHTTIMVRLDKRVIESNDMQRRMGQLEACLKGAPCKFDPANSDDMKTVNLGYAHVDARLTAAEKDNPGSRAASQIAFVRNIKVVPKAMKSEISALINSENPENVVKGAQLMEQLENTGTLVRIQLGKSEPMAFGRQVLRYTESGLSPKEAFEKARDLRNVKEADLKARDKAFGTATTGLREDAEVDAELITSINDEAFGDDSDDAVPSIVMKSEYVNLVKTEFMRTGDINIAKNNALASMRRVWGVHHQNGGVVFMKRPPHMSYGVGRKSEEENSAWIMEQLIDELSEDAAFAGGIDESRIVITPHQTRSNGNLPAYQIFILPPPNQVGVTQDTLQRNPATGEPLAWWPKYDTSRQKQRDDGTLTDAIARAQESVSQRALGGPGGGA
jgi:hypothetical protein